MSTTEKTRRFFSLILALIMIVCLLPVNAFAASNDPIVLIGGGDYQQAGDHANSSANVTNILKQITAAGITSADGFLFIGDYDCETHDSSSETSAGITSLMSTMQSIYSNLSYDNSILVQGNHDYADSRIDASGGHTFDGYSVFVMNEDDYPNGGGSSSQAKNLSAKLDDFLASKLAEGYSAPIFVTSHVPLHFGPRTNRQGDGKYAKYYVDVMNAYGSEGLNIIFMHGHNHAYGYDEYIGGEAIYLPKGDKINIAKEGSTSSYTTETLNFTYMNAGYTGYYNESGYSTSSGTDYLTMTTFQIYDDKVVINRFSEDGLYNMKSAGQMKGDYISSVSVSANSSVYASAQTIKLTAPAERITLQDTVTGVAVTGVKVDSTFDDNTDLTVSSETVDLLENAAKCTGYQAYSINFVSEENVTISLPVPESYPSKSTKVYRIDSETLTAMDATISSGSASFVASSGGMYAVVSEITTSGTTDSVYYQRVESVSDLTSGKEYLIIFDCSSQTTADAIVIPEIATYSSGSSKRVGPDVIVSDGIADEDIITGSYDNYLWTLTKSGKGWLIGTGSQNLNVTYNSTSSRCEVAFTTAGEALTIAAVSSNPSDADSSSFAVYDSSNYYWQYNTSATLIYGTTSDSYTSRFHFYERVENSTSEPEVDNGWVSMPSSGTYVLDTDGIDPGANNKYIIVGNDNDYALTVSNGTVGRAAITVKNNTISVDDPSIYEFYFADNSSRESNTYLLTQDGTDTVYHSGGNMYYGSDSKGYWYVGSSSNGSYKVYDYDNLNWYLNYGYVWASEAVSRFAVSSNSRYVRLFKSTSSVYGDTFLRLTGETEQTHTIADAATEASVLKNVSIEVTNDGYHVSDTFAVTSDMVTWDVTFDGKTAGTYVASVTYEGQNLGTITVTISAEHDLETITVDATCTEDGSITTKCTICGEETVEIIKATGHNYECVKTEATCGTEGSEVYTCSVCADSYTEIIPATENHSYTSETVDATCTEAGTTTYTCSLCGHSYVDVIAATGHTYTSSVTAPTCTEDGCTTYICDTCGHSYTDGIQAAFGHTYDSVITATCTEDGYVVYTCKTCSHSYNGEVVAAYGHSYESTTVAPTCATAGYTTYVCSNCGDTYTGDEVAALGHNYESVVTEATCTEAGYTTHTCSTCGHSYVDNNVAALGHDYESVVTDPTFETEGFTTHTCKVCGDVKVDSFVPVLSHDYETVTMEATCTEDGSVTHTCVTCGYSYTEVLPAYGHSYETVTSEATCETNGSIVNTCSTCGNVETIVIPATGHSYETNVIDPTCTAVGYTTYTCACGHVVTEEIPSLGHNYVSEYTAPTCTEPGGTAYTCSVCGDAYTDVEAALGHSYESHSVAPTCTTAGYTTYTCAACGDSYTADEIAALGHSNTETVTAPTCTEVGYTTYTCTVCGKTSTGNTVSALGHKYSTAESNGYLVYTCDTCGDSYSEKVTMTYTKVSSISGENNYVITLISGNKYYALSHKDNKISVSQITVSNKKITSEITEDLVWTYEDSKLSYADNGTTYYLYAKPASGWFSWWSAPTLTISSSNSTSITFSSSKVKMSNYYLRYSGGNVSLNRSATTTYFFIEE